MFIPSRIFFKTLFFYFGHFKISRCGIKTESNCEYCSSRLSSLPDVFDGRFARKDCK